MKYGKIAFITIILALSTSVNAALIDDDEYTTDDVNGLEWLDLSYTSNVSYGGAYAAVATQSGGGWDYASETQVRTMFDQIFPTWTPTNSSGFSAGTSYIDQADRFTSLFGSSYTADPEFESRTISYGLYLDDSNFLRMLGVNNNANPLNPDSVYGTLTNSYPGLYSVSNEQFATFMVRASAVNLEPMDPMGPLDPGFMSPVPVPAAVWLFGSGLIGLIGIARRKARD